MDYTYIIKPTVDVTQAMIDVCEITSLNTPRNSSDGRSVLKWRGEEDPVMFAGDTKYDQAGIDTEMLKPEWTSSIPSE